MKLFIAAMILLVNLMSDPASNIIAQGKLEMMVIPTSKPLNWGNPTSLKYGFFRTYAQRMISEKIYGRERTAMGHGLVRALCFTGDEEVDFWSGFNGNRNNEALKLFLDGAGLSVFLYGYNDGYIQNTEFVNKYISDILKQPAIKPSFVRINVNQEQCRLIKQHFDEFNAQDTLWYGFFADAEGASGAGCTSYVVSYAQKAGIFPPFLEKNWTREVRMSTKLLGPTDQAVEIDGDALTPISIFKFLNPLKPVKWNRKTDKAVYFSFPDPQYMVDFMRTSIKCLENPSQCNDRPDIMNWLMENKAKIATNEYMRGIEISVE